MGERAALVLCRHLIRDSDGFVDVGAHVGYFVFFVYIEIRGEKPIFFFEPDLDLFRELEQNVRRNGLANVTGFEAAIGADTRQAVFYRNNADLSRSSLFAQYLEDCDSVPLSVEMYSFSKFMSRHSLDRLCVKVDIENAEFEFLSGIGDTAARIRYLIMEILGPAISEGFVTKAKEIFGMEAYYINDYRLEHSPDGSYQYVASQCNWLFCRHAPNELRQRLEGSGLQVVAWEI